MGIHLRGIRELTYRTCDIPLIGMEIIGSPPIKTIKSEKNPE